MERALAGVLAGLFALAAPAAVLASNRLSDVDVRGVTLQADRGGHALVSYTLPSGATRHVFVWGATDARTPQAGVRQVRLSFDYAGGYRLFRDSRALGDSRQRVPPVRRARARVLRHRMQGA